MSFKVTFYTFSKKENSTAQPNSAGTEVNCVLKDGCSQLHPVIKLDLGLTSTPHYNYCYIPAFGRYYWLSGEGWMWEDRQWQGTFNVDPLASWKTNIGTTSCYVLRSSSDSNGEIIDTMYPATNFTECIKTYEGISTLTNELASGSFVVGILSGNTGANFGSVTYYAFDKAGFATFIDALMGDQQFQASDISTDLYKAVFNPFQYVVGCVWLPTALANLPILHIEQVKLGWWSIVDANGVPATAGVLDADSRVTISGSLDCAAHPQATYRGNFLNAEPYRTVQFHLMPFGNFNLSHVPVGATSIGYEIVLDSVTGLATLYLTCAGTVDGYLLATVQAQLGVPIAVSQKSTGVINGISGVASGALTAASGLISENPVMTIAGGLSAIKSAIEGFKTSVQTIGASGGVATTGIVAELYTVYRYVVDDDNADRGRPLCEIKTINTLSGYIMCSEAHPAIPCSENELSAIVAYMNGGFFYE